MNSFAAAVESLKKGCCEYEDSLKKTLVYNSELKGKVENMANALAEMKRIFKSSDKKCDICATRTVDTALLECGHCMCSICSLRALRAGRCPFCRGTVAESMKLYL